MHSMYLPVCNLILGPLLPATLLQNTCFPSTTFPLSLSNFPSPVVVRSELVALESYSRVLASTLRAQATHNQVVFIALSASVIIPHAPHHAPFCCTSLSRARARRLFVSVKFYILMRRPLLTSQPQLNISCAAPLCPPAARHPVLRDEANLKWAALLCLYQSSFVALRLCTRHDCE